jgi:hypothetical protein
MATKVGRRSEPQPALGQFKTDCRRPKTGGIHLLTILNDARQYKRFAVKQSPTGAESSPAYLVGSN